MESQKFNVDFIKSVRNPLGFYAFAVLIIYASMTIVLTTTNLDSSQIFIAFILMAILFFLILVSVTLITILWPKHLYENIAKDVEELRLFSGKAFVDAVKEIVQNNFQIESKKNREE